MTNSVNDARHYSLANVDSFWSAGNPVVLPVTGAPPCTLDIHPRHGTITLTAPLTRPEPDVAKWQNISCTVIASDNGDMVELTVAIEDNLHAAYGLLTSIADQLQLEGQPLAAAVATAIAKHRSMFAGKAGVSPEKEVGLFGELLVLEDLIDRISAGPAVEARQGPSNEEHDFVLEGIHLEIKTTSGEQRRHVIHGFMQLVPLYGMPLSLISIQLTRTNKASGRTLAQIVGQLRAKSGGHRPKLDDALHSYGWRDEDADLYRTSWTKRNELRAYNVDETFPALTLPRLSRVIPNLSIVSDLSYRVDVTQFANHVLPGSLASLVEAPKDAP